MRFILNLFTQRRKCLFLSSLCVFGVLFIMLQSFASDSGGKIPPFDPCSVVDTRPGLINDRHDILDRKLIPFFSSCHNSSSSYNKSSDWTVIEPHTFVYSAYIDNKQVPEPIETRYYVKILSIILPSVEIFHTNPTLFKCYLKYIHSGIVETRSYINILPEHHSMCYRAAFIYCPVPAGEHLPYSVALSRSNSTKIWFKLLPAYTEARNLSSNVSICVRPFFGPFGSIAKVVEFVSYYQTIGVTHFYFYDHSITPEMSSFLRLLSKRIRGSTTIHILPWTLPAIDGYLIHAEGQVAFIQDCLLRVRTSSRYVAMVDLDEFIMPQNGFDLGAAIAQLDRENPNAGTFVISMIMFCEEYLGIDWDGNDMPMVTQFANKRQETPWMSTYRSKYIAKPFRVNVGGIHEIWEHVYPYTSFNIPSNKMMLYHYRSCCGMIQPWFYGFFEFSTLQSDRVVEDNRMRLIRDKVYNSSTVQLVKQILHSSTLKTFC